jgi:hypothetical protein
VSLDSNAQPKEQKRMINQEDPLQVKSIKLSKPGPKKYHGIKLVFPPHRCTTTTGVLTFEWTYKNKTAKSAVVEIENLATGKKISLKSRSQKRRFYVQEGQYRWRVIDSSTTLDSQWRSFKTVELNAGRDVSSLKAEESAIEKAQNSERDDSPGDIAIFDSLPQAQIIQRQY